MLSPLTDNTDFTVTNSAHFLSTISSETILDNEIMASFDADSLFTNVPIDATVQAALQKLQDDPSLADVDRTTLAPTQITDQLNLVLKFRFLQYKGSIFELAVAAMASPVSAVIDNLFTTGNN